MAVLPSCTFRVGRDPQRSLGPAPGPGQDTLKDPILCLRVLSFVTPGVVTAAMGILLHFLITLGGDVFLISRQTSPDTTSLGFCHWSPQSPLPSSPEEALDHDQVSPLLLAKQVNGLSCSTHTLLLYTLHLCVVV